MRFVLPVLPPTALRKSTAMMMIRTAVLKMQLKSEVLNAKAKTEGLASTAFLEQGMKMDETTVPTEAMTKVASMETAVSIVLTFSEQVAMRVEAPMEVELETTTFAVL